MEPEIIQLTIQRVGMEKISLRAELTGGVDDACRLVIAWPVGSQDRHFDATDYYECLREFRRVIIRRIPRSLSGSPAKRFPLWDGSSNEWCLEELRAYAWSAWF